MSRALGRYELLRPLARGGMGEVYLARRRAAGVEKWLVVKRMRPERAGDARFLDLFMREARLTMSLAHQNIVPVFDFGRIDDQVFLAMERVEGKDLGSTITKAGKGMPALLAAFVAAECLQALDYAHHRKGPDGTDLGIVHRDVTPRNVLLSWSGEVKLTDFGIAALAGDEPSKMAGTPAYMAPEQARGESLDVRADIYAVGMVLREALTGKRGRQGNDRDTVLALAKQGQLDPWPEGFESPLKAIVDKATANAKEERYPDARAMLAELDDFMVAERAAKKSEAPARLLAAWLTETWQGERDDVTISDVDIQADHMLSFLDDGLMDVIGTGTQRSLAMTAAESAPAAAPLAPPIVDASALKPDSAPVKAEAAPAPRAAEKRSRVPLAVAGVALAGAGVFAVIRLTQQPAPVERLPAPVVATHEPDAGPPQPIVEAKLDAPVETPIDAGVADAPARVKPPRNTQTQKHPDHTDVKQTAANPPLAVVARYKVEVSAPPYWSHFTVDSDPTVHDTPHTLELTPGPHTFHFTGNDAHPADKTVTVNIPETDGFKLVQRLDAP